MKQYIKLLAQQLRDKGKSIIKTSTLINKPWFAFDEKKGFRKLFFKSGNVLLIVDKGNVIEGKWNYLPEAKSLVINESGHSLLYNEHFVSKQIIVLAVDLSPNDFLFLLNDGTVPEEHVKSSLRYLRNHYLGILEMEINDGRIMEIHTTREASVPMAGDAIMFDNKQAKDGIYKLSSGKEYFEVQNGHLLKVLIEDKVRDINDKGITLLIQEIGFIQNGDYVLVENDNHYTGHVILKDSTRIDLFEGKVVDVN